MRIDRDAQPELLRESAERGGPPRVVVLEHAVQTEHDEIVARQLSGALRRRQAVQPAAWIEDIVGCKGSLAVLAQIRQGVLRPGAMQ